MQKNDYRKLRNCPFCGGEAKVTSDEYRQEYINPLFGSVTVPAASKAWAYCTECGAMGREEHLKKEAVEAWNKRVADDGKTSIIV